MKTSKDPRHIRRIKAIEGLFAHTFNQEQNIQSKLAQKIINDLSSIDRIIKQCAPEWPLEQINKIDLSVLRLAIYELLYQTQTPPKVIIDEAVEIGKQFGSSSSGSFINGVLGTALVKTNRQKDLNDQDTNQDKESEKK